MSTEEEPDWDTLLPGVDIPKSKPTPPRAPEHLEARLQSQPALTQVTVLPEGSPSNVPIVAVLEIPQSRATEPWEIRLRYAHASSAPEENCKYTPLLPLQAGQVPQTISVSPSHLKRFYFEATVPVTQDSSTVSFNFEFRGNGSEAWRSIRDEHGLDDGQIIVAATKALESETQLSSVIPNLDSVWDVRRLDNQQPSASAVQSWLLSTSVRGSEDDAQAVEDIGIGTAWGSYMRWFAIVRETKDWIAPRQGNSQLSLDRDALLCSFLSHQGQNLVFVAMNGGDEILSVFRHTPEGAISVQARNNAPSQATASVVVVAGSDFETTVAAAMWQAKRLISEAHGEKIGEKTTSSTDALEPWYDGLGFCTWNAMGQGVTEDQTLSALSTLEESNIKVTNLIIDDGWQSVDSRGHSQFQRGMTRFEAKHDGFAGGLKSAVSTVRNRFPYIKHVAVWHTILGYWGAISPEGEIARDYKTVELVRTDPDPRNLPIDDKNVVVAREDLVRFYSDFYQFLADSGIDGVKTDNQSMIDQWVSASARLALIPAYLDAWTEISARHFGIRSMSCMSQIPQTLFRCYLRGDPNARPLVRNSCDYFPEVPASHPLHVWINAHNSVLTRHMNLVPDWDMFQTVNPYAGFHAAARCISGGPVYITDVPGEHDADLIRQMTGTTPDGRTVIFRLDSVGRSMYPYSRYEDDVLLKVGAYHEPLKSPVMAIFNIATRPLTELISLSSFPEIDASTDYIVKAHSTGNISAPTRKEYASSLFTASLNIRDSDIYTAFPVETLSSKSGEPINVANLGLLDKMTGCAAVVSSSLKADDTSRDIVLDTKLKALGVLGVYIATLPNLTLGENLQVTLCGQSAVAYAKDSGSDSCVLKIDLAAAWMGLDLKAGDKNLVPVSVCIK